MPVLCDRQHEIVARELALGKTSAAASRAAGYNDKASSFVDNARKRANRKDIRARVAELQANFAELAELDRGYVLLGLKEVAEFKLADYLQLREDGRVAVKLKGVARRLVNRIGEIGVDPKSGRPVKIKGHRIEALSEMARILGLHKDPLADAVHSIGERLKEAFERAARAE